MGRVTKQQKSVPKLRFTGFHSEWQEKRLGNIAEVSKLAGYEYTKHVTYQDTGKVIALRGLNIKNNKLVLDDVKYIDNSELNMLNRSKLFVDDLMFTYIGTIGEVALIDEDNKYYLAPNVSRIRLNKSDAVPRFVLFYFNLNHFKYGEIAKYIASSSQPALSMESVRKFRVMLPEKSEQQKIADFLGSVDAWLDNLRKQKVALETYKRGMMQKLFTQKVRFKDEDGKDFPEWTESEIGAFAEIYQPQTISQSVMDESAEYSVWGANGVVGKYKNYNHELPQVIVTCRGSTCGTVNMTGPNVWITGNAMVFNIDGNENVVKEFLYYNLKNDNLNYLISGSGQPQITGNIKHHKMMFPIRDEQQKIADFLKATDETINAKAVEIAKVEQWKKGLMQKMFI